MVVGGDGCRRCFIWCSSFFIWCAHMGDPGQSNDKGKGKGRYFRDFSDYDPDDTLYDNHWLGKAGWQSRLGVWVGPGPGARSPRVVPGGPRGSRAVPDGPGGSPEFARPLRGAQNPKTKISPKKFKHPQFRIIIAPLSPYHPLSPPILPLSPPLVVGVVGGLRWPETATQKGKCGKGLPMGRFVPEAYDGESVDYGGKGNNGYDDCVNDDDWVDSGGKGQGNKGKTRPVAKAWCKGGGGIWGDEDG